MMPFPLSVNFIADVVAKSGGFMDDEGIDLDLQFARSAPQALQQLAAGNVTVVRNGPVETVQAIVGEDAPFVTIGMPNQRTNYTLTSLPDEQGAPQRVFVCQTQNPWGYPAKDRSGRSASLLHRYGSERWRADDVADSEDPRDAGLVAVVHLDGAISPEWQSNGAQVECFHIR